jgi:hypothetical protein
VDEADLPLRFERPFQVWSYQVSHRRLVLRSRAGEPGDVIEVEFLGVLGMKLRSSYDRLAVTAGGEAGALVEVPERHRGRFRTYTVSDGRHDGFVICGAVRLHTTPA